MLLAAFLNLHGERAVVVGGGVVASRRVGTLLRAEMRVSVIAPTISPELRAKDVTCMDRAYVSGDVVGARLVLACTDSPAVNDRVTADALKLGLLVGHAGDAARGNLRFPATLERGGVTLALTSGRELPMLAQALKERLGEVLPEDLPLDAWVRRREQAVALAAPDREAVLEKLRREIRLAVGLVS
ncbi:precorrin-2 dehydrogenase/sirohydrochlorin ferrochelatase family protein [Deinococcus sp.]|uniref:precorrin-2 dehydrogenase/sirohydrochlorin ferrochelatase family protein n=1 Tax=Deinococcus sp. TaxID=47478 RepID=UPI003C7DC5C2